MILGINSAYHESAAALIDGDGRIVAAAEEERFTGRKHGKAARSDNAHHLPWHAIRYCLREASVTWRDLSAVAYSLHPTLRRDLPSTDRATDPAAFGHHAAESIFLESLQRVPRVIAQETKAPFLFVPHHVAHAWYAIGTSTLERAAVLVVDGIGERASISAGFATRAELTLEEVAVFPDSVGLAWEKVSRYVGLTVYDACKVMALAGTVGSAGQHVPADRLFSFRDGKLWVDQDVLILDVPNDYAGLDALLGSHRGRPITAPEHKRLAAGIQEATERFLIAAAAHLVDRYGERGLVYGGGVALNCRANHVLALSGAIDRLHVGPATHDAGTALGAAWHAHTTTTRRPVPPQDPALTMFSGPALAEDTDALLQAGWHTKRLEAPDKPDDLGDAVDVLLQGFPIGWLDGRTEFGPRALGARSILASPLHLDAITRVKQLKGRHEFEPLALAVPEEDAAHFFIIPEPARDLATLMLTTAFPTAGRHAALAHVLHADGTTRLQVVRRALTPRLHALLRHVGERSGLPLLVNTSFNPRGDPMPATLAQALSMTERLGLSHLVVNGRLWTSLDSSRVA